MKTKVVEKKLWTCPRCKRKFERRGQPHSCRPFPLAQHFRNKPEGRLLYQKLKQAIKEDVGPFKVESLECCIHFVGTFTFAAVKIFRDKISVDFSLSRKIQSDRIRKVVPMSTHRYLYVVDVMSEEDIDASLLAWIHEAYDKKNVKRLSDNHDNE